MELCSGGELFDRIIEWLGRCSLGKEKWVGLPLGGWVYLKMGYPIPSIGLSMIVIIPIYMGIWGCSPFWDTPDWWTWSLFCFQKFVVQSWCCFRATSWTSQIFWAQHHSKQIPVNPNSAGIQLWIFPKHLPARCSLCPGFWSILVIFKHALSPLNYLSICLSICLSVYLSIYLSICLSMYPSIYLCIYLSIYLSIYLPIYLSVCLSIYLPTYLSIYLSLSTYLPIYLSIHLSIDPPVLSIYLSVCLSVYLSSYPSIYRSIHLFYLSIYLSVCLSINLSIYQSIYLPIYLPIYLSMYLSFYLSIYLSIYLKNYCN